MSTATCGQCGAGLRQGQAWCSLCLAGVPDAFDPLTAPLEELAALGERPGSTKPAVPASPPVPAPVVTPVATPVVTPVVTPVTAPVPTPAPVARGRHSADAERVDESDQGGLWQPPSWMSVPAGPTLPASPDTVGAVGEGATEGHEPAEVTDFDVMFSMLSAEHRAMDPASGLTARMDDKSARVAIMVGGALIIGAVVFLGLTVLGAIF